MRIMLIYRDALKTGGYPRDIRRLSSSLADRGLEVLLFADEGAERGEISAGVEIREIRHAAGAAAVSDLAHVFGPFIPAHLPALRAAQRASTPVIVSTLAQIMPHVMRHHLLRKEIYLRAISPFLQSACFHAFGPEEEKWLRRRFPRHRILHASLGLYPFGDGPLPEEAVPAQAGPLRLLFFGRNDIHQKGIDILLEGFSRALAPRSAEITLTIAGMPWGDSIRRIEEMVRRSGLRGAVTLAGPTDQAGKAALYSRADYLVFLSRWDGPPRPVRDAITVGLPVVVSPETNMGHLVEEFGAGVQVALDPDAVAGCLRSLASTRQIRTLHAAGAAALRERLSWDMVARDYADMYREAAGA